MKIFSSLTSQLETITDKKISIYVCGVTPYTECHLGHAMSAMIYDSLIRFLRWRGNEVIYVSNYTDIDDKIIDAAKAANVDPIQLAKNNIEEWEQQQEVLGLEKPNIRPKVTEEIETIIIAIEKIIENGYAYVTEDGGVYYSVRKNKKYGELSHRKIDELQKEERENDDSKGEKIESLDFALWKPKKTGEPGWSSPWGEGRPGWHIECSAMSEKYLGENFSIHGGGTDLIFPHHENEIAQSCCANKTENFANYWLHNGFVTFDKEKMSKSIGNIVTINKLRENVNGQVVRLALLSSHYKQPLDWNKKLLNQQKNTLDKWYSLYEEKFDAQQNPECFDCLLDDLNTPEYISKLHELYNGAVKGDKKMKETFNNACRLIGIFSENKQNWEKYKKKSVKVSEDFIINKINERLRARKSGDYKLADKIRDDLLKEGVLIEDKKDKTDWKYK